MVLVDDADEKAFKKYNELCNNLNMDKEAANQAWQSYETIKENYSLEGDQIHWLGCALYIACRKSSPPTVAQSDTLVEGNLVSLTRLLRLCKMSFIQFINKIKKWADMTKMPDEFRGKIEKLERNFAVSTDIFKKFQPIFAEMFHSPVPVDNSRHKPKKLRASLVSLSRVFDFTWALFICVKSELTDISDDLVNSYHLLLSCCDLIYMNAVLSDRKDLLNTNFAGLPRNFHDLDYSPPSEPQCIIHSLCQKYQCTPIEAKSMKEYCWKNYIRKMFEKKILRGNPVNFSELLETANFEQNLKSVNKMYEEYVLSVGEFDERIFLGEDASYEVGTSLRILPEQLRDHEGGLTDSIGGRRPEAPKHVGHNRADVVSSPTGGCITPLTGRDYLRNREPSSGGGSMGSAQGIAARLRNMLGGRQPAPGPNLLKIIRNSNADVSQVEERVKDMASRFCGKYTEATSTDTELVKKKVQLAVCLYYKLVENILTEETKKPNSDCSSLMSHEIFHQTVFACCLEIVMCSYPYCSQTAFPWVLEALSLEPYHFYKIIEIIVRAEDQLSRDMVKHLNSIEERILESLAWKSDSPLWSSLAASNLAVPTCEEVSLPGQLLLQDSPTTGQETVTLRRVTAATIQPSSSGGGASGGGGSVSERFQSPVSMGSISKKRIYVETGSGSGGVKPGQSLLQNNQQNKTITIAAAKPVSSTPVPIAPAPNTATATGTNTKYIPIQAIEVEDGKRYIPIAISAGSNSVLIQAQSQTQQSQAQQRTTNTSQKPKRVGSLAVFFRKFYHLASVRMQELCNQLDLMEVELRRKIWTCFEHTVVEHTDLMLNRHLDQLLMCAVYVICKIVGKDKTFTEVMKCYRSQPQCISHVYRNVLIKGPQQRTTTTPTGVTGGETAAVVPVAEERGDLIMFYNTVYVMKVQPFVIRFNNKKPQNGKMNLSPLPVGKSVPMSPRRRVSEKHSVYIRPLVSSESISANIDSQSPARTLGYCFSRSPAKDLRAINTMIQVEVALSRKVGRRLLLTEEGEPHAKQANTATTTTDGGINKKKVHGLCAERLTAKVHN